MVIYQGEGIWEKICGETIVQMGRVALSVKEVWDLGKPLIESLEPLCFGDTLGEGQGQAEPGRDKMRKRCRSKKIEYSDIISLTKKPT